MIAFGCHPPHPWRSQLFWQTYSTSRYEQTKPQKTEVCSSSSLHAHSCSSRGTFLSNSRTLKPDKLTVKDHCQTHFSPSIFMQRQLTFRHSSMQAQMQKQARTHSFPPHAKLMQRHHFHANTTHVQTLIHASTNAKASQDPLISNSCKAHAKTPFSCQDNSRLGHFPHHAKLMQKLMQR